jgi:hypothetical protein
MTPPWLLDLMDRACQQGGVTIEAFLDRSNKMPRVVRARRVWALAARLSRHQPSSLELAAAIGRPGSHTTILHMLSAATKNSELGKDAVDLVRAAGLLPGSPLPQRSLEDLLTDYLGQLASNRMYGAINDMGRERARALRNKLETLAAQGGRLGAA